MTQSGGQGGEQQFPAERPAHEGVVLPAGGGEPWIPGPADQAAPAGGEPWGGSWGPQAAHQNAVHPAQPPSQALPPPQGPGQGQYGGQAPYGQGQYDQPPYGQGQPGQGYAQPGQGYGQPGQAQPGQVPPGQGYGYPPAPQQAQPGQGYGYPPAQPLPPQQQPPQPFAQPLPPEAAPGAAPGAGAAGAADATQYIAPVPGGLPPENPAESTAFLGRTASQPQQQAFQQPGQGGDAEATQYIPPVPGGAPYDIRPGAPGDRQPPAEFDNLFRNDESAGGTQQMPRLDHGAAYRGAPRAPQTPQPPPPQSPQSPYGPVDEEPPARRKRPHVTLIAAVVAGCAVVGLGAGALISGNGDDEAKNGKQPVAAASGSAEKPAQPPADPAKPQAEALDKLLADSNNSRAAVIGAVEKTKSCTDLDQAVTDLKDAARQRRDLVTRLGELSVDQLPDHARLTDALTRAWQASASADDHYAAWAAQAKHGKKVCKHGRARTTSETQQATVQSGVASKAKQQASTMWNSIATKYGLTRRAATEL
ncbi:hypothetical protein ACFVWY_14415 [Streptomyces sp. NPDC058195]|uniref:hypothetical protein n=1 Tax=Streptomyces sp. NPDC058195 TaxID=3346375 RepID=UPI0036EF298B